MDLAGNEAVYRKEFEDLREEQFISDNTPIFLGGQRVAGLDGLNIMNTYDWMVWTNVPTAKLWEMVALHCFINPEGLSPSFLGSQRPVQFKSAVWYYRERLAIARRHVEDGLLVVKRSGADLNESRISFPAYAQWTEGQDMPLPPKFPRLSSRRRTNGPTDAPRAWPWGSHDTVLLGKLAQAGELWRPIEEGGNYDPLDDTTAPTNDQIKAFLESLGVGVGVRKAMATILRSNFLPQGRRTSKRKKTP